VPIINFLFQGFVPIGGPTGRGERVLVSQQLPGVHRHLAPTGFGIRNGKCFSHDTRSKSKSRSKSGLDTDFDIDFD
jgi:hypothetical protein